MEEIRAKSLAGAGVGRGLRNGMPGNPRLFPGDSGRDASSRFGAFGNFLSVCRESHRRDPNNSRLVHCVAGWGNGLSWNDFDRRTVYASRGHSQRRNGAGDRHQRGGAYAFGLVHGDAG